MGKPVVASRLPMVERTFAPGTVATYEPGDARRWPRRSCAIVDDPLAREAAVERTRPIVGRRGLGAEADALRRARRPARERRRARRLTRRGRTTPSRGASARMRYDTGPPSDPDRSTHLAGPHHPMTFRVKPVANGPVADRGPEAGGRST